jgi:hypothetical protein
MTTAELNRSIHQTIDECRDRITSYDERAAIQEESRPAHLRDMTTSQIAEHWLQQPDTSWGRHATARAWLRTHEPHARVFVRVTE